MKQPDVYFNVDFIQLCSRDTNITESIENNSNTLIFSSSYMFTAPHKNPHKIGPTIHYKSYVIVNTNYFKEIHVVSFLNLKNN